MNDLNEKNESIIKLALDCGANNAAGLSVDQVILDEMFADICKSNTCGNYGKCYMCPPDAGDIHEMMETLRTYQLAAMYQTIHSLEDSFDYEGMMEASSRHVQVSQCLEDKLRELKPGPYLHLSVGGCNVCEVCAKRENLPCPYPDRAMPSLEVYGVDVYQTAQNAGLKYVNGQNTVTYFGLVLIKEA
ncbi:MAG: DUF2284 domain-containing protein [Clostridiales bacterium]|nr:DUF2284 domain-containing protein [Clostridiales bacterium]